MEPIIEIKDLKMNYGDKKVLRGIDLNIHRGEIIGYIGPNGAGKSTTVKIMLGLVEGYSGEVKIFGQDIKGGDIEYKRKIGYVPETVDIYENLTAREYLNFTGELYGLKGEDIDERAIKLMKIFGIDEVYDARISSCSKGMKQKILIISSLLHNPDILFWDEPLSGLDANSAIVVKDILASLSSVGKTIFYSSHVMEVVEKVSNRIILINNGEIVADGTFEELKNNFEESSLENIFSDLTGFNSAKALADEFVDVVQGVKLDEGI